MIGFNGVLVDEIPDSEWIFFTSKNSVRFFFKSNFNIKNRSIACVGSGTYKELAKHVKHVDFVGNSVDVQQVGKEFSDLVGDKTCLFPVSNISKRTIQKYFSDQNKVIDFPVYETFEKTDFDLPECDVLIFTSPSNARAYFKKYEWKSTQKVISIGPSTGAELEKLGVTNYVLPKITGELGLIDLI